VLGFGIAFLGLDLYRPHTTTRSILFFPLLSAALPLLDTVLATVRRLRNRSSPFSGDRFHFCDLLSARGWPARRIVLALYGVTAALAAVGLCGVKSESPQFWAVAAISVGLLLYAAIRLGSLRGNCRDETARRHSAPMMKEEYGEPSQTD
jgi:hypothetical protein